MSLLLSWFSWSPHWSSSVRPASEPTHCAVSSLNFRSNYSASARSIWAAPVKQSRSRQTITLTWNNHAHTHTQLQVLRSWYSFMARAFLVAQERSWLGISCFSWTVRVRLFVLVLRIIIERFTITLSNIRYCWICHHIKRTHERRWWRIEGKHIKSCCCGVSVLEMFEWWQEHTSKNRTQ
mgnify:CR=1 FL=1